MKKKRVLFIAEAVTLAHVARPVVLGQSLDTATYEVHLAREPRFDKLFGALPFHLHDISSISCEDLTKALESGKPVYDTGTLESYVSEDLALIRKLSPDVVVGDFRLSLAVSAPLRGVPYLALCNAYWSPYATLRYPVPDLPLTKYLPLSAAQLLFNLARPLAFASHSLPLNRLRRRHRLPSLGLDVRRVYTHADHTLYVDIPELIPTSGLPANHHYLGPVLWSPQVPLPDWWDALPQNCPIIYLTLGSSGAATVLPRVLKALAEMKVHVIAATAGRIELEHIPRNAFMADYLPGDAAVARSQLVICNGGSPASHQALAAGVPVLGIATNMDQLLNMQAVCDAGAGERLRSQRIREGKIRQAVAKLLNGARYGEAAQRLAMHLVEYHAPSRFGAVLRKVV